MKKIIIILMLLTINNCFAMKKLPEMIPKVSHKALIPCTTLKKIKKINTEFTDQELKIIGKIIKNNEKLVNNLSISSRIFINFKIISKIK